MNIHPLNKIKIAGTILGVLVVGVIVGIKDPGQVRASGNANVHGWLWSDMPTGSDQCAGSEVSPTNPTGCPATPSGVSSGLFGRGVGYISLNNTDPGMSGNYSMSLDDITGDFSGLGWSEYGGWLDPDATGFPVTGGTVPTPAKIMPSCWNDPAQTVCKVIGWMRFTGATQAQAGGWDGWLSLNTNSAPLYGVSYNKVTKKFSGVAWGSSVVGWVNFDNAFVESQQNNDVCIDPLATNAVPTPLSIGQINNPATCTYPQDICKIHPEACLPLSPICKIHPELCTISYYCNDVSASNYEDSPSATQVANNATCLYIGCMNKCSTTYDSNATISDPSMCIFPNPPLAGCTPGDAGSIKPIYKEN